MAVMRTIAIATFFVANIVTVQSQLASWPHDYPGKPSGDLSPEWQDYFRVKDSLPNITFELPGRSWAGNIPVQSQGRPNNTLFFWAFEKDEGSLTAHVGERSNVPWAIYLDGSNISPISTLYSLLIENGPIHGNFQNYSLASNNFSWSTLADFVWLDYTTNLGYSTSGDYEDDNPNYKANTLEETVINLWGFVANLIKVFPSLAQRPLYLIGNVHGAKIAFHAATFYFGQSNPPASLAKLVLSDAALETAGALPYAGAINLIETYPQLIGYDPDVYKYFKTQSALCGYDHNLTYPQQSRIPFAEIKQLGEGMQRRSIQEFDPLPRVDLISLIATRHTKLVESGDLPKSLTERNAHHLRWKRDLSDRANGSIDPWYGCHLTWEIADYAANFTYPWSSAPHHGSWPNLREWNQSEVFNFFNVGSAIGFGPLADRDSEFFNDPRVRTSLHAPTSKDWNYFERVPLLYGLTTDPSLQPSVLMNDFAANASTHNVSVVLYNANGQVFFNHRTTEIVIQNTTFGGIQGFTRKPSTPWNFDDGSLGGIVHQERGWTYGLLYTRSSIASQDYQFLRKFVFGNDQTGLVMDDGSIYGGENSTFPGDAVPAPDGIAVGSSGIATSTYTAPSATIAAWRSFISTVTATPLSTYKPTGTGGNGNSGVSLCFSGVLAGLVTIAFAIFYTF